MLKMTLTDEAAQKLKTLLEEEGDDMCIRIRETQVGTPCKRKIVLRLSFDERGDDDVEGQAGSLPFVIEQELSEQYGLSFSVDLCAESGLPTVTPLS